MHGIQAVMLCWLQHTIFAALFRISGLEMPQLA
jgi:hypothetical protein